MVGALALLQLAWAFHSRGMERLRRLDTDALLQLNCRRHDDTALALLQLPPADRPALQRTEPAISARVDGRGRYDRTGTSKRQPWRSHVQAHMHDAVNGILLGRKVCGHECPSGGRCLEEYGSIRVLKECANILWSSCPRGSAGRSH